MSNFFLKTKKEQYNCKQYKNLAEDEKLSQMSIEKNITKYRKRKLHKERLNDVLQHRK